MSKSNVLCMHPMKYREIAIQSTGPVLIKQERCSQCGKIFKKEVK